MLTVLRRYHFNATSFVVTQRIPSTVQEWSAKPRSFMSWEDIDRIRWGYPHLEFHSHSHDQHDVIDGRQEPILTDYNEALNDVQTSMTLLDSDVYAYPFGHVNDVLKRALRDAGYRMAFCANLGVKATPDSDRYCLPRLDVNATVTLDQFEEMIR